MRRKETLIFLVLSVLGLLIAFKLLEDYDTAGGGRIIGAVVALIVLGAIKLTKKIIK